MQGIHPPFSDYVIGAAIFDLNGLPKEYFTTGENTNISWVQTIFQALGLRSLLMSSLKLEGFQHAIVHGKGYNAIVVKQNSRYTALLLQQTSQETMSDAFVQWVQSFEPNFFRNDPRFRLT